MPALPDWTRASGIPAFRGQARRQPDDFRVTEILDFPLSGEGEHDYLWLEKEDANTGWVAGRLARHAGIREADVGFAGLKDRKAVTRQWFSVRRPSAAGTDWQSFSEDGIRILDVARHHRKLRRGAHSGNAFRIVLCETQGDGDELVERLVRMRGDGVPNYFGEQRFGREGNNLVLAERLFAGARLRRDQRGFALSAARAFLFNHLLQRRVAEGTWNRLQPGDCACLDGSNSYFACTSIDAELEARCRSLDVHPGGSLWGRGEPASHGAIRALEEASLQAFPSLRQGLEAHADRAQRALRLAVRDLEWSIGGDRVCFEFTLTRGGYATAVLRELADYRFAA